MAQAARDQNNVTTLLAVSSVDGVTPVVVYANPTTHRLLVDSAATASMAIGGSITGATQGSVLFAGASGVLAQDNSNFYWDSTNKLLGIGTSTFTGGNLPATGTNKLIVNGTGGTSMIIQDTTSFANFVASGATEGNFSVVDVGATSGSRVWNFNGNDGVLSIRRLSDAYNSVTSTPMVILANGFAGFGTTNPLANLVVNGTVASNQVGVSVNNTDTSGYSVFRIGTASAAAVGMALHQFNSAYSGTGAYSALATTLSAFETGGLNLQANASAPVRIFSGGSATANKVADFSATSTLIGTNFANYVSMAGSASNPVISALGSSTNIDMLIQPKGNGQVVVGAGGWTYTTASTGAGSLFLSNGTSDSPNIKFAYANLSNLALDTASCTLAGTVQALRFIKNSDETGGAEIGAIDLSGNLFMLGSIGSTAIRNTKGWFTNLEVTNAPTLNGVAIPSISSTNTLTNKRITKRISAVGSSATPTVNTDNADIVQITSLAVAITSMTTNLSGTPAAGDMIMFQITDNGSARAITWGASFASTTVALPTTTVASTMLRIGFQRNNANTVWDCIAVA
jgi:hypothetical protein